MNTLAVWFYRVLAVGSAANGLWMLAAPTAWFTGVPAAVPDTGPVNVHFVLDLGVVFVLAGLGAWWCSVREPAPGPVHWGLTFFYGGHALVHVAEIVAGRLPASHWLIDAPLVFLPALLLLAIGVAPLVVARAD